MWKIPNYIILIIVLVFVLYIIYYLSQHTKENADIIPRITLYYTSWCGYSQAFIPEWKNFENLYKKKIHITKICCDDNQSHGEDIKGYPSVYLYLPDKKIFYQGERTSRALEAFVDTYL